MYWFLTTPRSGSNFIMGEVLRKMGARPRSQEFFGKDFINRQKQFVPDSKSPVASYIDYISKANSVRGILGVKLLFNQVEMFMKYGDFPSALRGQKIVYLYRNDVIKQAISYYFATQTQQWTSVAHKPPVVALEDVQYSFTSLNQLVSRLERHNAALRRFLLVNDLDHMTICYEDFVREADEATVRLLQYLGINPKEGEEIPPAAFASQSTERNKEFYERFIADQRAEYFGDGSYLGAPLFR